MASAVRPGERVLFVGPRQARFLARIPHARHDSQTASTLLGSRCGVFDVVAVIDAASFLSDDETTVWASTAAQLVRPGGSLVVASRPFWVDATGLLGDLHAVAGAFDLRRLVDADETFRLFTAVGFVERDELHAFGCAHVVKVFDPPATATDQRLIRSRASVSR